MKPNRLSKAIEYLKKPSDRRLESFDDLDSQIKALTGKVQKKVNAKALEDVNQAIEKFQKSIDLKPVLNALESLKGETGGIHKELASRIEGQLEDLVGRLSEGLERLGRSEEGYTTVSKEIGSIREAGATKIDLSSMKEEHQRLINEFEDGITLLQTMVTDLQESVAQSTRSVSSVDEKHTQAVRELTDSLEQLRRDLLSKIAGHGGNANRNIAIGGNTSVLSSFTDLNLKPGNGVTITYTPNQTTKYTDVTITATGSGSGITREINSVAVDTAAGSTAGIDYVYLVSGTTMVTLPTAVGNENLYTIKNVGDGVVTVDTTGGQTIDDDSTIVMPVKYTSVDIISNNSNWKIT